MDESVLNFAKQESLNEIRANPDYTFNQLKVLCKTVSNNGTVKINQIEFTNKCFFISLYNGLVLNQISTINNRPLSVGNLMIHSSFLNINEMIDTDNKSHINSINQLITYLPQIQIHVFIGQYIDDHWYTTPDPSVVFGKGNIIIRILNKHDHFEYICNDKQDFVRPVVSMTKDKAYNLQNITYEIVPAYQVSRYNLYGLFSYFFSLFIKK